jgi:hypothetical protein
MPSKQAISDFKYWISFEISTGSELKRAAFITGSKQGLNCSLYLLPMVTVTPSVRCELAL